MDLKSNLGSETRLCVDPSHLSPLAPNESSSVHCECSRAGRCIERLLGGCDGAFLPALNGAVLHWCPVLCVSLPLEAAGALSLCGYLYVNESDATDG